MRQDSRMVLERALSNGVLVLTMNRPERRNALSDELADALAARLEHATSYDDLRVVVLRGAGTAFCAGADIRGDDLSLDRRALDRANRIVRAIVRLDSPVVVVVQGAAAGVGCSIALAGDLLVAAESASFLLAFARVGLMPDGGSTATVAASIGRFSATIPPKAERSSHSSARRYAVTRSSATATPHGFACLMMAQTARSPRSCASFHAASVS
jgi:enoyl-CoA hydratase